MKKTEIKWCPFPQEKPKVVDEYLVTVNYGSFKATTTALWKNGRFMEDEDESSKMYPVTAWAEMPEPYEEEGL